MRFTPRKASDIDSDGLRYIGRWPRSESRSMSDGTGGWLTDCMVKVGQGAWIFAISIVGLVCGVLTLWSLPAEAWWAVLSAGYFVLALYLPWLIVKSRIDQRDWTGTIGSSVAFVVLAAVALWGFERLVWDWLDAWTRAFFTFSLPVVNGWAILMMAFVGIAVVGLVVKSTVGLGSGLLGILGSLGVWLWTCDFARPGLMFYLLLAAVDTAYAFAAWGTLSVLWHEQGDVYEPYGSESPEEKREPEVQTEHHITPFRSWPRKDTEEAPRPIDNMPTIASLRPKDNRKDSELVPTSLRVDEFCEALGRGALMGLGFREMCGRFRCTGREITAWNQWVELLHPLVVVGIYDREHGRIHPGFVDEEGHLDPIKVLDHLGLERYDYLL